MTSLIVKKAANILNPVLLVASLYLLLRGHYAPGGGFEAGLLAASAFVFHALAYDVASARRHLKLEPHFLIACGLLLAAGSGIFQMFVDLPFMTGLWFRVNLWHGFAVDLGTPEVFDLGVYCVVLGTTLLIFFNLKED
jgi:multicomponent Na+:H+ antiporter subunit B